MLVGCECFPSAECAAQGLLLFAGLAGMEVARLLSSEAYQLGEVSCGGAPEAGLGVPDVDGGVLEGGASGAWGVEVLGCIVHTKEGKASDASGDGYGVCDGAIEFVEGVFNSFDVPWCGWVG